MKRRAHQSIEASERDRLARARTLTPEEFRELGFRIRSSDETDGDLSVENALHRVVIGG